MADIVASILSRDRPELTVATIDLMYRGAADRKNIDIHLVIDSDQIDLYAPVLEKYPEIKLGVVEHEEGNLRRCFLKQLEMFRETSSYFMITLADDMTAVVDGWDEYLIEKKGYFKDDLFTIHSNCRECFRSAEIMRLCYCPPKTSQFHKRAISRAKFFDGLDPEKNPLDADFLLLYEYCELFPVHTYKFAKYVEEAYRESSHAVGIDVVIASLVQQFYRLTGENRLVMGWPDNFRHVNNEFFDKVIRTTFKKKKPFDMKLSRKIAGKMAEEVYGSLGLANYALPDEDPVYLQENPELIKNRDENFLLKENQSEIST